MADWFVRLVPTAPTDPLSKFVMVAGFERRLGKRVIGYADTRGIIARYRIVCYVNHEPVRAFNLGLCVLGDGRVTSFAFPITSDPLMPLIDRLYVQYPDPEDRLHPVFDAMVTLADMPNSEILRIRGEEDLGYASAGFEYVVFGKTGYRQPNQPAEFNLFEQFYFSDLVNRFDQEVQDNDVD